MLFKVITLTMFTLGFIGIIGSIGCFGILAPSAGNLTFICIMFLFSSLITGVSGYELVKKK